MELSEAFFYRRHRRCRRHHRRCRHCCCCRCRRCCHHRCLWWCNFCCQFSLLFKVKKFSFINLSLSLCKCKVVLMKVRVCKRKRQCMGERACMGACGCGFESVCVLTTLRQSAIFPKPTRLRFEAGPQSGKYKVEETQTDWKCWNFAKVKFPLKSEYLKEVQIFALKRMHWSLQGPKAFNENRLNRYWSFNQMQVIVVM